MATIKVKQIKSKIGYPKDQKATLQALGLRKISQVVEDEDHPSARVLRHVQVTRERLVSKVDRCRCSVEYRRLVLRTSTTRNTSLLTSLHSRNLLRQRTSL